MKQKHSEAFERQASAKKEEIRTRYGVINTTPVVSKTIEQLAHAEIWLHRFEKLAAEVPNVADPKFYNVFANRDRADKKFFKYEKQLRKLLGVSVNGSSDATTTDLHSLFGIYDISGERFIHFKYMLSRPDVFGLLASPPRHSIELKGEWFTSCNRPRPEYNGRTELPHYRSWPRYEPLSGGRWDFLYRHHSDSKVERKPALPGKKESIKPKAQTEFEDSIPRNFKSEKHYRNKHEHARRTRVYRSGRAAIVKELGNRCALSSDRCNGRLELDHVFGNTVDPRGISYEKRLELLQLDHRNNLLRVLCRFHNASDGAKNKQGKARYKKYFTKEKSK